MSWIIIPIIAGIVVILLLYQRTIRNNLWIFKKKEKSKVTSGAGYMQSIPFPLTHTRERIGSRVVGNACKKCYDRANFCRKKILDLQDLLAEHEQGIRELSIIDVYRYRGMVEILTQVLE